VKLPRLQRPSKEQVKAWLLPRLRQHRRRLIMGPALVILIAAGSLEQVTDEPPPLDPRFYMGGSSGDATGGLGDANTMVPFADYDGPVVKLVGTVQSEQQAALDLDFWQVDPDAPGSRTHLGKVPLDLTGPFELDLPEDYGGLQIEAFHDLLGDGPSPDDPFGLVELMVGSEDLLDVVIALEVGGLARHNPGAVHDAGGGEAGDPPPHVEAEPGAPGGPESPEDAPESPEGGPGHQDAVEGAPGGEGQEHLEMPHLEGAEHQDAIEGAPGGEGQEHLEMPHVDGSEHTDAPAGAPGGPEQADGGVVHVEAEPGAPGGAATDEGAVTHTEAPPGAPGGATDGEHVHFEAAPGAPDGAGHTHDPDTRPEGAPPPPAGAMADPFAALQGEKARVSGVILYESAGVVLDLDVFRFDPSGPGGRVFVGKLKVSPGPFSFEVPRDFGQIGIDVFLDRAGDGPSDGDPKAACPCNPLSVRGGDVAGIEIPLE